MPNQKFSILLRLFLLVIEIMKMLYLFTIILLLPHPSWFTNIFGRVSTTISRQPPKKHVITKSTSGDSSSDDERLPKRARADVTKSAVPEKETNELASTKVAVQQRNRQNEWLRKVESMRNAQLGIAEPTTEVFFFFLLFLLYWFLNQQPQSAKSTAPKHAPVSFQLNYKNQNTWCRMYGSLTSFPLQKFLNRV